MATSEQGDDSRARSLERRGFLGANLTDRVFRWGTLLFALSVLGLAVLLAWELGANSREAFRAFGLRFLISSEWDPVRQQFGALPFIFGTVASSALALALAVPVGLGTAIFLSELAPRWLRSPISFLVELLAAVPSVVYGLWGIFVLIPVVRALQVWLNERLGFIPLFSGPPYGVGMMAAGLVLAIMILPFITAVSREVLLAVPSAQREAAYALGATRWEAIRGPVFRYARAGIVGAIVLALGRALGETMAVTMVIGNVPTISASLLSPAYSMASVLANEFAETTDPLHRSVLIKIALLLFVITIFINAVARLLILRVAGGAREQVRE